MKADQDRVRMLITQTITMLCKKGLEFESELRVQGLLGVTVDNKDIFLIHLNEKYDNVSDTKDVLPRQESVATSTGNERSHFSPQGISPDNGTACETVFHLNPDIFGVKAESDQIPMLQPNFADLQESMSDHFPYGECHTTGGSLLTSAECSETGFLMENDPAFSASLPPAHRDTRVDYKTSCGGSGGRGRMETGTIFLDSGDERDDDFRPQSMPQLTFSVSEADSKSHLQANAENKMALQSAYAPQVFKSSDEPNFDLEQAAEGSSQSWYLHPVSRSQFPAQSPGRVTPHSRQQMPFNPEHVGKFTIGSNRPPAMVQSTYHARGAPARRSSGRQPRPVTPGRGGVLSHMKPTIPNEEIGIRYSQNPTSPGGSMLWSPSSMSASAHSSGMSVPPVRGFPPVRRSYRARGPRASGGMSRGGAAAGAGRMLEFASGATASPHGQPGVAAGVTRAGRGVARVKARCVDGYSYGKQTVTNYICNICSAVYKNHSSLLTHQVKVHGRQKKEGKGRPKMQLAYDDGDDGEDTETEEMGEMM